MPSMRQVLGAAVVAVALLQGVSFVSPSGSPSYGVSRGPWASYGSFRGQESRTSAPLSLTAAAVLGCGAMLFRRRSVSLRRFAEPQPSQPNQVPPVRMPMISTGSGAIDVMSKLLQDRILMMNGQVNDEMANVLVAQILYLANQDPEKDITIYINSPGGSVSAGMAIFDAMQFVPCDVCTVCYGMAASMGAFLMGAGTKGKRRSLPNARIMIHQPLGGAGGQAADIEIQAKEILFLRDILNTYLADFTGKSLDVVAEDCDRDYYMTPEEASEYGIIDEVITTKSWPRLKKPSKPELATASG
ncbi:unnamed protein product [Effrenium voratum]|nr:unnamed protein product [Effrenium voratum]